MEGHGNPICEPCLNRNPFLNQLRVRSGRWGKLDRKAWQFLLLRYFYFCYEVLFLNCSPTTCHSLFRMIVHNSLLILYISKNSHLVQLVSFAHDFIYNFIFYKFKKVLIFIITTHENIRRGRIECLFPNTKPLS